MNILLPEFNMFSAAQLIKADLLNYLKQKNLLRRIDVYSFFLINGCLYLFDLG